MANQTGWSELPDGVAGVLFPMLHRRDAGSARLVCVDWARTVAGSWRTLRPASVEDLGLWRERVGRWPSLTDIDMQHARYAVTDDILAELPRLPKLTSLSLHTCFYVTDKGLAALAPKSMVTGLTRLDLSYCHSVTDGAALAQLTGLTYLDISQTGVRDVVLKALRPLTGLTRLGLSRCDNMSLAGLRALAPLTRLARLDLCACNQLTAIKLAALAPLTSLACLDLSHSRAVSDEELRALAPLTGLTRLNLRLSQSVGDAGVAALAPFTGLSFLNLCHCTLVGDAGLRALAPLTGLTRLNLNGCRAVTDAGAEALRPLTGLTHLGLDECARLTAGAIAALVRSLTALTWLDLGHLEPSDAIVVALASDRPDLRLIVGTPAVTFVCPGPWDF